MNESIAERAFFASGPLAAGPIIPFMRSPANAVPVKPKERPESPFAFQDEPRRMLFASIAMGRPHRLGIDLSYCRAMSIARTTLILSLIGFMGVAAVATKTPAIAELAPDFSLVDQTGKRVTLSATRGEKVVLVFYRGYW